MPERYTPLPAPPLHRLHLLLLPVLATLALAAAAPTPAAPSTPSPTPAAVAAPTTRIETASEWWQPIGFSGETVSRVVADGDVIGVVVNGHIERSTDGGITWQPATRLPSAPPPAADDDWTVVDGYPVRISRGATLRDPDAPQLGSGGRVVAPDADSQRAIAVADDGTVWRRTPSGDWQRALILLPQSLFVGAPQITGLAAFTGGPVDGAVYLSSNGYGVLAASTSYDNLGPNLTQDDLGADWERDDPGLPEQVLSIATDGPREALFAATGDGLYVHLLAQNPAPPSYVAGGYDWRVFGIVLTAVIGCLLALAVLWRWLPEPPRSPAGD